MSEVKTSPISIHETLRAALSSARCDSVRIAMDALAALNPEVRRAA